MTKIRPQDILMPVSAGLCCKMGGFHIDPVRPVERAVITHGHSDHARAGHGAVLATQETLDMMRLRYGDNFARSTQALRYGEEVRLGDVTIKFHPAGHVLGSAQVAVTCNDTCIVASGDYQDAPDPTTAFGSGWMRVRARARQRGVELPLVISDHADWDGLTATIEATSAGEVWVTHGQEDALVHWCQTKGLAARPLDLVGYGDEEESETLLPGEEAEV